jgi:hypothetical protein
MRASSRRLSGWALSAFIGIAAVSLLAPVAPASAIIGGVPARSSTGETDVPSVVHLYAVSSLLKGAKTLDCTGTLVGASWVLTAQHCTNIDKIQGHPFAPGDFTVTFEKSYFSGSFTRKVNNIVRMSGYSKVGAQDVALLHLSSPVKNLPLMPFLEGSAFVGVGQTYHFGYGVTSTTSNTIQTAVRRSTDGAWSYSAAKTKISDLACDVNLGDGCWNPSNLLLQYSIAGVPAEGDSGGPVVTRLATGQLALVGVNQGTVGDLNKPDMSLLLFANRVDSGSHAWGFIKGNAADALTVAPRFPDGTLIKEPSQQWVYVIYGGARFRIRDAGQFTGLGFRWEAIQPVPDGVALGLPAVPADGTVLRELTNPTVYRVSDGYKRPVSLAEYLAHDDGAFLHYVSDGALANIPNG